jgi:vitamin B12 transporter
VSDSSGAKMKNSYGSKSLCTSVRLTLTAIAVSHFSISAFADESLELITVTANRSPSANVLAPTTVITRADIDRLQITNLPSLLSRQPGIDLTVNGGIGKTSSIFMRGTNSDHVLILVDGVKWHSATLGSTSIQDFPVEQIERIEIVRGPRSGLYGAEALGGVIQIFTRQGQQGFTPYVKASYGTHDSKQVSAGVSGGTDATSYNLNVNHQSTEGIDAQTDKNPDKDDYRNNSLSANLKHQLTDSFSLGINFLRVDARNEYDGFATTDDYYTDSIQQTMGANIAWDVSDNWQMSAQIAESRDKSQSFTNHNSSSVFNTRYRFASIINRIAIADKHTLNLGFDYGEDTVESTTDYAENSRDNKAVFASWQAQFDKQSWLLSTRYDDNEAFGSHNTGSVEWGVWLQDNVQFSLNYGTAFKEPTFNDLYWPVTAFFQGNSDLQPEKSNSFAMNIRGYQSWGSWGVHAYNTSIRNLIVYQSAQAQNVNVDRASISGIEFEADASLAGWDIAFNATIIDPEDEATGNVLPRRAKRLANLHVDKHWGNWSAGASWKVSSYRYDDAANTTRLSGFGVADFRVGYQFDKDWLVQVSVSNVFDKEYQTVSNYNSLDTVGMLTLSYTP